MGWGPGDRGMLAGRITEKAENSPETAGAALCWMARVAAPRATGASATT